MVLQRIGYFFAIGLAVSASAAFGDEARNERAARILADAAAQPSLEAALEVVKPHIADPDAPDPDLVSAICLEMEALGTCSDTQLLAALEGADSAEMIFVRALKRLETQGDRAGAQADIFAAAEAGLARAQFFLGEMYLSGDFLVPGDGLKKNGAEAQRHLAGAAEGGDEDAMNALGFAMLHGAGVEENLYEGIYWLEQAVAAGHASAQFELAYAYQVGLGVAQDADRAVELFVDAGKQGHPYAYYEAARAELSKPGPYRDVTSSLAYLETAAARGVDMALVDLAGIHDRGLGPVDRDTDRARSYLDRAAKSSDPRVVAAAKEARRQLGGESIADVIRSQNQSGAEKVGEFFRDLLVTAFIIEMTTGRSLGGGVAVDPRDETDAMLRQWNQDALDGMSM